MGIARLPRLRVGNAASNCGRFLSSSAAVMGRPWTHSADESEYSEEESGVYRRALKIQRPTTVRFQNTSYNYVSLIGTIEKPLERCNSKNLGFHTSLKFEAYPGAYRHLRLLLNFWDEMAEVSVQYLKPDDLIYVSGHLKSYTKKDESGQLNYNYKVVVKEVDFVVPHGVVPASQNLVKQQPKLSFEDRKQRRRDRLHLWQIFFASPHEWHDKRSRKFSPRSPDFVHKDTREALWLNDSDPPWVRQQLQLYDSRSGKQNPGGVRNAWSRLTPLVYDDT